MRSLDPAAEDAFSRAFELLDGTDPETVRTVERRCDLALLGRGTTRLAFDAAAHVDGGSAVVKVAIRGRGGVRATEREVTTWERATPDQRPFLAPVFAADPDHRWAAMPRVETGVPAATAAEFHERLTEAGLVFRDLTPGDVGIRAQSAPEDVGIRARDAPDEDGGHADDLVLVDYAGCRPVEDASVTVAEMRELVDRRWDDW